MKNQDIVSPSQKITECGHPEDKKAIEVYGGICFDSTGVVETIETVLVCTECGECVIGQQDDLAGFIF